MSINFYCPKHGLQSAGKDLKHCPGCVEEQFRAEHREAIERHAADVVRAALLGVEKPPETLDETILQEAQRLVYGERNADYGHPHDDYTRVGAIWGAMLQEWAEQAAECYAESKTPLPVPPTLAALMMCAVKISREVNKPKRDNRVDLAGYAACVDRIVRREEGKE